MVSHMEERARAEEQSAHIVEERERTLRNIIRAYENQRSRATIAQLEGKLIQLDHTCIPQTLECLNQGN